MSRAAKVPVKYCKVRCIMFGCCLKVYLILTTCTNIFLYCINYSSDFDDLYQHVIVVFSTLGWRI